MTADFSLVQWNPRGLSKSRLEEFKNFLCLSNPSIVLLSETFWNKNCKVKFKNYQIIQMNSPNRPGGGVVILVSNTISYTHLDLPQLTSIEAVGVSITSLNYGTIDIISAYCPKGDCSPEEIGTLIDSKNEFIVGGDFNGHHGLWETNTRENKSGKSIYSALIDHPEANLITPHGLTTYINPGSGKESTIDLTFTSPTVSVDASVRQGPYLGSDHLPLIIQTDATLNKTHSHAPRWVFTDDKWPSWNSQISCTLAEKNFINCSDPTETYSLFYDALLESSNTHFKTSAPNSPLIGPNLPGHGGTRSAR